MDGSFESDLGSGELSDLLEAMTVHIISSDDAEC